MENSTTAYTKTFSIDLERTNYHLKMKKRKQKRIITVLVIWVLIIIYFLCPLSRVNLKIKGNVYYTKEELVEIGYINENKLWWLLDSKDVEKVLESYDYINNVEIKKSMFGTKLTINEIYPVGIKDEKYILSNGYAVSKNEYPHSNKIEKITSFDNIENSEFEYLVNKYSKVELNVRNQIDKLEIIKDSNDYKYIKVYGNDERIGYFIIKVDLVYLDTKFNENKYNKIIGEVSKNNVKYSESNPVLVAYHGVNEEEFTIVDVFEEE